MLLRLFVFQFYSSIISPFLTWYNLSLVKVMMNKTMTWSQHYLPTDYWTPEPSLGLNSSHYNYNPIILLQTLLLHFLSLRSKQLSEQHTLCKYTLNHICAYFTYTPYLLRSRQSMQLVRITADCKEQTFFCSKSYSKNLQFKYHFYIHSPAITLDSVNASNFDKFS